MVSKRFAEQLWRPLAASHGDLIAAGRWCYVVPIRHVVRGILLNSSRYDRRGRPEWAVMPLFEPATFFDLSWGEDLRLEIPSEVRTDFYEMKAQSDHEHAAWLKENYGAWVLPKLRGLGEIRALFDHATSLLHAKLIWPPSLILFHAALGEFDRVREIAAGYSGTTVPEGWLRPNGRPVLDLALEVIPLVDREDRARLADLLHGVEAETARNIGVEHLWERTPFPFQEHGG
jgi:hypothetical protein